MEQVRDINVLVAGSGNITGLNVIRALNEKVLSLVGYDYASPQANPANLFCQNFQVSPASSPKYVDDVIELVKKFDIKAIIASNDHDVRALAKAHWVFAGQNVVVNGLNPRTLQFLNKLETSHMLQHEAEVMTPIVRQKGWEHYPCVVRKEVVGSGQKFTYVLNTKEDAALVPFDRWDSSIITDFVRGEEYTVDILCDQSSNVLSVVPRLRREVRAGIVHFGEVVANDKVIQQSVKIAKSLHLTGVNCIQCIVDSQESCWFFEVNPRPGSGIDLTTNAGVNMPLAWLDVVLEKQPVLNTPNWGMKMVRFHDGYFFK